MRTRAGLVVAVLLVGSLASAALAFAKGPPVDKITVVGPVLTHGLTVPQHSNVGVATTPDNQNSGSHG